MDRARIERALSMLGSELAERGKSADVCLAGGASTILILGRQEVTMDVDAYFTDPPEVREAARRVAGLLGLPPDWLNDAVKRFFYTQPPQRLLWESKGVRVFSVEPDYLFAMKAVAARAKDTHDLKMLVDHLGLRTVEEALAVVERYIPDRLIGAKTKFAIEALFDTGEGV